MDDLAASPSREKERKPERKRDKERERDERRRRERARALMWPAVAKFTIYARDRVTSITRS